jgi:choline kinase
MIAIILAAGLSKRLRPLTNKKPKCLLDICGETLITRYIKLLSESGVDKIVIITGYKHDLVYQEIERVACGAKITCIYNQNFAEPGNHPIDSFLLAEKEIDDDFLLLNSDIYFSKQIIGALLQEKRSCVAVDASTDYIVNEMFVNYNPKTMCVTDISKSLIQSDTGQGKSIQVVKLLYADGKKIFARAKELTGQPNIFYPAQAYDTLIAEKRFFAVDVAGEFSHELDTVEDYNSLTSNLSTK